MTRTAILVITGDGAESFYPRANSVSLSLEERGITGIDLRGCTQIQNLRELNLGLNPLGEIDLTPLSSLRKLESIALYGCYLDSIDLSPLSTCSALRDISLDNNFLEHLDLEPLSSCRRLRSLFLQSTYMQTIDLSPLGGCAELENLYLFDNRLSEVDLYPLSECPRMKSIDISYNALDVVDLTPLTGLRKLNFFNVNTDVALVAHATGRSCHHLPPALHEYERRIKWLPSPKAALTLAHETEDAPRPSTGRRTASLQSGQDKGLSHLRSEFKRISQLNEQERGLEFERLVHSVFKHEGLRHEPPFRTDGEQHDGLVKVNGTIFILELKWEKNPARVSEVDAFQGGVGRNEPWVSGIFWSMSGYSAKGLMKLQHERNILLFDASDLHAVLNGDISFGNLCQQKISLAAKHGRAYVPWSEMRRGTMQR